MERVRFFIIACSLALLVAGCGGGSDNTGSAAKIGVAETIGSVEGSLPRWVESELAAAPGGFVSLTLSSSDFAVGSNRLGFLIVRQNGQLVQSPRATVWVGEAGVSKPARTEAVLVPLEPHSHPPGSPPHDHLDATDLYVAHIDLPATGRYWVVATPEGTNIQGVGSIEVAAESATPAVGAKAPRSDNPTLADAPAEAISTARPPDTELLRDSIAGALDAHEPFIVVFATPKYCESRTCGPTVETVDAVRRDLISSPVRWIHVEIYEDNDPAKGTNEWVKQWNLPSEPWVFVVDEKGVIRAKFEGAVSKDELEQAVRSHLL
jgi:hypothetical protein